MRRPTLAAFVLCAAALLTGCQIAGSGKAPAAAGAGNAITGGEIEVTALDALPGEAAADAAGKPAAAADTEAAAAPGPARPQVDPAAQPATDAPAATEGQAEDVQAEDVADKAAEPAPKADLEAAPVTPKSEQQLACEKKRGKWARIGKGEARACVYQTKDGGKRCTKESDCDGVCLARSGTCSPLKPLYGCNEILQDNGARVTLCLD